MPSLLDRFKSGNALTDAASVSTPGDNALHEAIMRGGYRPRQSLSVMDTYKPQQPAYAAEEPGLAGGVPTEGVTGLELSPLDLVGTGALTKAAALAKAFGVPLAAALGATGIASRASQGAKLSGLAEALPGQRGIFAGVGARTANLESLAKAKEMQNAGISDELIHKETGWFFGSADGKPRFEIPDNELRATKLRVSTNRNEPYQFNDVFTHPELEKAYTLPDVYMIPKGNSPSASRYENIINIPTSNEFSANSPLVDRARAAAHELQHPIQREEGFATGSSPDNRDMIEAAKSLGIYPGEAYFRSSGEVEARNVARRMNMTPEERAASYPPSMFDVPVDQQIVRYGDGQAMSVPQSTADQYAELLKSTDAILHPERAKTALPSGLHDVEDPAIRKAYEDMLMQGDRPVNRYGDKLPPTEAEIRHVIAQRNSEFPVDQGGLGLHPDNTAMDRAKAMGFDTPAYHGTGADIREFDPLLSDTRRGTGTPKGAIVVSSNPDTASSYANMDFNGDFIQSYSEGGNVIPVMINKGKNLSHNAKYEGYPSGWNSLYVKGYPKAETTNDFAQIALDKGKQSATIKNVMDNARDSLQIGNTTFLFNPNQLRSRFAAFDPMQRNSANLLAGSAAGGLSVNALYDLMNQQEYQ